MCDKHGSSERYFSHILRPAFGSRPLLPCASLSQPQQGGVSQERPLKLSPLNSPNKKKIQRRVYVCVPLVFVIALVLLLPNRLQAQGLPLFADSLADAQEAASLNPDWQVMRAKGYSMMPYFGEYALLLVDRCNFEELQVGMIAVYQDSSGDLVSHQLIRKGSAGWQAQGYNNTAPDPDFITQQNFVGVVFGTFNAHFPPTTITEMEAASRLPVAYGKEISTR